MENRRALEQSAKPHALVLDRKNDDYDLNPNREAPQFGEEAPPDNGLTSVHAVETTANLVYEGDLQRSRQDRDLSVSTVGCGNTIGYGIIKVVDVTGIQTTESQTTRSDGDSELLKKTEQLAEGFDPAENLAEGLFTKAEIVFRLGKSRLFSPGFQFVGEAEIDRNHEIYAIGKLLKVEKVSDTFDSHIPAVVFGQWIMANPSEGNAYRIFGDCKIISARGVYEGMCKDRRSKALFSESSEVYEDGYGVATYYDGSRYFGEWKKGQRFGVGLEYNSEGDLRAGYWRNDSLWKPFANVSEDEAEKIRTWVTTSSTRARSSAREAATTRSEINGMTMSDLDYSSVAAVGIPHRSSTSIANSSWKTPIAATGETKSATVHGGLLP